MPIPFIKYSGCGNDFILVDSRIHPLNPSPTAIAKLCNRSQGIGADGLLLVDHSATDNGKMRIFNADGTEAEMCGNGVRCVAHYLSTLPPFSTSLKIETMHQHIVATITSDGISTEFPSPYNIQLDTPIELATDSIIAHSLNTGVPHAVLFTNTINDPSFPEIAKQIRHHKLFAPKGTNVNLAQLLSDGTIALRTYERGVEGETLACGTGAVATALTAASIHNLPSPVIVFPRSGTPLTVSFSGSPLTPQQLMLKGSAVEVFKGSFLPESFGFSE